MFPSSDAKKLAELHKKKQTKGLNGVEKAQAKRLEGRVNRALKDQVREIRKGDR